MLPPELGSNAAALSETPEHPSIESHFPPPEPTHSADLAADVQAIDASGVADWPGDAQHRCDYDSCGQIFKRRQELTRHLDQVHNPVQECPFNPCRYTWKRPDKIKAHIINVHGSNFCPEVLEGIHELRGKKVTKFIDALNFGMRDTYLSHLPPLLEQSNVVSEEYYLRCVLWPENKSMG